MIRLVKALIVLPVAILVIALIVANRHQVVVGFDPIDTANPAFALEMPMFLLVLVCVFSGVVIGSVATWFGAADIRREARTKRIEAAKWRREAERHGARPGAQSVSQSVSRPGAKTEPGPIRSLPLPKPQKSA